MRWAAIFVCTALLQAGAASARPINLTQQTPGWTYFHRVGANIQTGEAELRSCLLTASTVPPYPGGFWYAGPGLVESVLANVIGGAIDERKETVRLRSNTENCMVVQGWEVVRVSDEEGRQLSALKREQLSARLSDWIGAGQPHGEVVRRWGNESDKRAGITTERAPGSAPVSLSLLALTPDDRFLKKLVNPVRSAPTVSKGQMVPVSIPLGQIGSAPKGSAVIIVTLRGPAASDRMVSFWRSTPDLNEPAWADGQPYAFAASMAKSSQATPGEIAEATFAFAVPPGPWKFMGFNDASWGNQGAVSCLGSPFFEASAGDIIYAGEFDFTHDELAPNMASRPESLVAAESSAVRDRVHPAKWLNGARSACLLSIYALEFPDIPYVEGYRAGGNVPQIVQTPKS